MRKVLLIQSRERPEMVANEQSEYRAALSNDVDLQFLSALDTAANWDSPQSILHGYNAVLLGGSGEFSLHGGKDEGDASRMTAHTILARVEPLVAHALENSFPILGVCFGHQLMAEMHGGKVENDAEQTKAGSYDVELTEEGKNDVLFSDLPQKFTAQYGHHDSVTTMPRSAVLMAKGDACRFSALKYSGTAYTMQFHPELTREDVIRRFEMSPGYLPEGIEAASVVRASPEATRLLQNFVDRIVG